jgi:hypothetical protein
MPNFNGMGPGGAGQGTGRGMGFCAGSRKSLMGSVNGRGFGRHAGWASVGFAPGGSEAARTAMRAVLEERKAYLSAELERMETLLAEAREEAGK